MSSPDTDLLAALRAEYDLAHDALRPEGVEAVRASALRSRRHRVVGIAGLAVLLAAGGVAGWRLANPEPAPQQVGGGCGRPGTDVSIFLKETVTDEQRDEVRQALADSTDVYCVTFETRNQAWENFKRQFTDAPDLVNATNPESLPESFRIRVPDPGKAAELRPRIAGLPAVSGYICSC